MRIASSFFCILFFSLVFKGFSQDTTKTKTKKVISRSFHVWSTTIQFGTPKWHALNTGFTATINNNHTFYAGIDNSNYGYKFSNPYYDAFRSVSPVIFPTGIPVNNKNYSLRYTVKPIKRVSFDAAYYYTSSQADYSQQKHRYYYSDSITDMVINTRSRLNSANHNLRTDIAYVSKNVYKSNSKHGCSFNYSINANWLTQSALIESFGTALYKPDSSSTTLSNNINGHSKERYITQNIKYSWHLPLGIIEMSGDYNSTRKNAYDSLFNTGENPANPLINYNNSQRIQSRISKDDYKVYINYSNRKSINLSYTFELQDHLSDRLNNSTVDAERSSSLYSNTMHFQKKSNKINASYGRTIRSISFRTVLSYEVVSVNTKENFPLDTLVLNTYHNPGVDISLTTPLFTQKIGKLSGNYVYSTNQPDITQLQPYIDNTQLNQWFSGNRGLTQTIKNSWSLSYTAPHLLKRIKADVKGVLTNTANERTAVIQLVSPDFLYDGLWQAYKGSPMFSYANLNQQKSGNVELNTKTRITKNIDFDIKAGSQWYSYSEITAQNYTGSFGTTIPFKIKKAIKSGKLTLSMHTNHTYKPAMIGNSVYFMNTADHTGVLNLSFDVSTLFKVDIHHNQSFKNISFSQNAYDAFDLRMNTSNLSLSKTFLKRCSVYITASQDYTKDITHNRTFDNHFLNTALRYKSKYGIDVEFFVKNILNRNTQVGQTYNSYYIESYSNSNLGRVFFLKLVINPESFVRKITVNLKKGAKPNLIIDLNKNR